MYPIISAEPRTLGQKILFVSGNGPKKNRVGTCRSAIFFLLYFLGRKCVFYACFMSIRSWKGRKNFKVGIFLNKNLLE